MRKWSIGLIATVLFAATSAFSFPAATSPSAHCGKWTLFPGMRGLSGEVRGLAALSPRNIWAVGNFQEHRVGTL